MHSSGKGFGRTQSSDTGGKVRPQTLEDWMFADLRSSGITDTMIEANFEAITGDLAVQILSEHAIAQSQSVQYVTREAQSILRRYDFAKSGGWISYGTTLEGGQGEIAYFKPQFPRIDCKKCKPIKYETPAKCEALPLLPYVDLATAQRIYEKYSVAPGEGEPFWNVVRRCNLPIAITEGFKKAVFLTQQGYPAIALRGVCNWHSKGSTELFPILQEFATAGRAIRIVFDQDSKPKTIRNVGCQLRQLGQIFQNLSCKVSVTRWDSLHGKGIDDAFVKRGADWLDETIATSLTLDEWKKCGLKRQYFEIIRRLKTLQITPERDTTGDYLPELPAEIPIGSITAIGANMGSGKSFTGINQTVRRWIENGGNVLRLDPLLSLGAQGARDSNLVHSSEHDLSTSEGYSAFQRDISVRHGAAVCFNSLHRIPQWFLTDRPLLLVLDEVNQGLDYLIEGSNLGSKHSEILDRFSEICLLCAVKGAIICAEAEIHPRSIELLRKFSGSTDIRYFKHYRQNATWKVTIGSGDLSGFSAKILLDAVEELGYGKSKRFFIPTDSQASGKKLDRRLQAEFPNKKLIRIDSETNRGGAFAEFFDDPDTWLEQNQPDFLIVSPSVRTGVSITWEGFDAVYGYFVGAIDPDGWFQMLGRYRPSVPRFVCCPKFVVTQGDESLMLPKSIREKADLDRAAMSAHYVIEALEETDDRKVAIRLAAQEYYSEMSALRGAQKVIARDYLESLLNESGHTAQTEEWGRCNEELAELVQIRDEIDLEDAQRWANSGKCKTIDAAHKILASECSLEDEIKAKKTLACDRFPDIDFDDLDNCLWILIRNRGKLGRGVEMQAAAENTLATKELDRESIETICSDDLGMTHRMKRRYIRAQLLQQSGILQLADCDVEFSNSDPRCIAIQQWVVKHAKQLRYYFGLTIVPEYTDSKGRRQHTPVDVCGKLLKKIGLKSVCIRTQGKRGAQERVYSVAIDLVSEELQSQAWEMRGKALAAVRERLNLIVPIEIPTSQTEPESAGYTEERRSSRTEPEQSFEPLYSQDFRRRCAA